MLESTHEADSSSALRRDERHQHAVSERYGYSYTHQMTQSLISSFSFRSTVSIAETRVCNERVDQT